MKLIENWRQSWKLWSIQLGVLGTVLTSIFLAAPDAVLYAWALLPEDIKSHMPPDVVKFMGIGILVMAFVARIVKQPKLEKSNDSNRNREEDNQE